MPRSKRKKPERCRLEVTKLEDRLAPALIASQLALNPPVIENGTAPGTIDEVQALMRRAAAATSSNDAIIAVVDRGGAILGVLTENGEDGANPGQPGKTRLR